MSKGWKIYLIWRWPVVVGAHVTVFKDLEKRLGNRGKKCESPHPQPCLKSARKSEETCYYSDFSQKMHKVQNNNDNSTTANNSIGNLSTNRKTAKN